MRSILVLLPLFLVSFFTFANAQVQPAAFDGRRFQKVVSAIQSTLQKEGLDKSPEWQQISSAIFMPSSTTASSSSMTSATPFPTASSYAGTSQTTTAMPANNSTSIPTATSTTSSTSTSTSHVAPTADSSNSAGSCIGLPSAVSMLIMFIAYLVAF